ncbi:hypothetical protein FB567DRAFT_21922 [Paraphoma chrysanthemicola]|uniref:Uncharacterized protein n=1 Tax=Paraphoma chrysanthemicola TaxID=798071 RepID=A0A8K0RI01_9PLEO|nr:hypothetical protein FB567DRAFT_21922 [Paraphoma chrysanthemicola]
MTSKRIFSWSKRQSGSETYYRTGGIVPIDASPELSGNNGIDAKPIPKSGRKRPSDLKILTEKKQVALSPQSAQYNVALVSAASNLQGVFDDMLRSPAPFLAACPRSASLLKPLPQRPRSLSLPSTPDSPAELPGSILQENQGFPPSVFSQDFAQTSVPIETSQGATHLSSKRSEDEENLHNLLDLFPEPLAHAKSVPDLGRRESEMRSIRSGNALNPNAPVKPSPSTIHHKKSLSETSARRRSKSELLASPSASESKIPSSPVPTTGNGKESSSRTRARRVLQPAPLIPEGQTWKEHSESSEKREFRRSLGPAITPTPTSTRSKQIEELKATIATQDYTISTLQGQFSSLRASHESHVARLTDTHSAEVASLSNYARILEEQQRPSLHHASSNNLLFLLDTTEPRTPSHESSQPTAESGSSATSTKSFQSAFEKQQRSPQRSRNSPEMESLKRKLSTTRRPETTNRNLLPELNQYKQNNVALQKQIESLMAKLNEAKKNERATKVSADEAVRQCEEWREKAMTAEKTVKSAQALQNTIDHLENRLEIANIEKLDAQEQLFNVQSERTPFDFELPRLQVPRAANHDATKATGYKHMSMSTVFSSDSPVSPDGAQETSTLAAFVAHIERLQDQVRQKDATISELELGREQLLQRQDQLERDQKSLGLQMDIQNDLMRKTGQSDTHIHELRTAVIDRETIIDEKEKSVRLLKKQLEHHKLLLHAQIRRNATLTLHAATEQDALPDLSTLAKRKDIDKWVEELQVRLRKEKELSRSNVTSDSREATLIDLRDEIDFYVREIILYKLDIRGYKSDIKKLKRITAQMSSYGSRVSDLDSETSSLRPAATPNQAPFSPFTPELGSSDVPSPSLPDSIPRTATTGAPASATDSSRNPRNDILDPSSLRLMLQVDSQDRERSRLPDSTVDDRVMQEAEKAHRDPLSHSMKALPATPPSPNSAQLSDMFTNVPRDFLPSFQRHGRSMSESVISQYATAKSHDVFSGYEDSESVPMTKAGRSASISEMGRGRTTPERPPRPRYGLFESPSVKRTEILRPSSPPRADVVAEALRHAPRQEVNIPDPLMSRHDSNTPAVLTAPPIMARYAQETTASSPSPMPLATHRSRAGSTGSSAAYNPVEAPSERKLSATSASSIPFVIGMGSPHNPAIVSPIGIMPPTSCSITRNAPLKLNTSRAGVGGTMASCTPVTSPVSPTNTSMLEPPAKVSATKPTSVNPAALSRKFSLSRKHDEQTPASPRTPSHSRNVSGSSIRTAIRLPKGRDKERDAHKMRKDSIGLPQPLGSPFAVDRAASEASAGAERVDRGDGRGQSHAIGEAI